LPKLLEKRGTKGEGWGRNADLVVEPALLIEVFEESGIGGTAPEVQVGNLKVAPNWVA
jgi:hypothetical protein